MFLIYMSVNFVYKSGHMCLTNTALLQDFNSCFGLEKSMLSMTDTTFNNNRRHNNVKSCLTNP